MPVYVDPLMACVPNKQWPWNRSCHMVADTLEELHAFAEALGLKRAWFQSAERHKLAHYDLTIGRREKAVRKGAIELSRHEFVDRFVKPAIERRRQPAVKEGQRRQCRACDGSYVYTLSVRDNSHPLYCGPCRQPQAQEAAASKRKRTDEHKTDDRGPGESGLLFSLD
jgi:hypothetical protein